MKNPRKLMDKLIVDFVTQSAVHTKNNFSGLSTKVNYNFNAILFNRNPFIVKVLKVRVVWVQFDGDDWYVVCGGHKTNLLSPPPASTKRIYIYL